MTDTDEETMTTVSFTLTGLQGTNFQGFMAALGVLRLLDDSITMEGCPWRNPRLSWADDGAAAIIHVDVHTTNTAASKDEDLSAWLAARLEERCHDLSLPDLPIKKTTETTEKTKKKTKKKTTDNNEDSNEEDKEKLIGVSDVPSAYYKSKTDINENSHNLFLRDFFMAVCTDMAENDKEPDCPAKTPILLFSGNMNLFSTIRKHAQQLCETRCNKKENQIKSTIFGYWQRNTDFGGLRWDPGEIQEAATLSIDPRDSSWSETAAVLLAIVGLTLLPCQASNGRAQSFLLGRHALVWPLWTVPATLTAVRVLLALTPRHMSDDPPDPQDSHWQELAYRGVPMIGYSTLFQIGQYQSVSPGKLLYLGDA